MSVREAKRWVDLRWRESRQRSVTTADEPTGPETDYPKQLAGQMSLRFEEDALPPASRTCIRTVDGDVSRASITLREATVEKLRRARELLGGKSDDEILARALDLLLEQKAPERRAARREKRKARAAAPRVRRPRAAAATALDHLNVGTEELAGGGLPAPTPAAKRPAPTPTAQGAASAPAAERSALTRTRRGSLAARDAAFAADGHQCAYVSSTGKRCTARRFLEVDHVRPFALGGVSEAVNFRILCRAHNAMYAERSFTSTGPQEVPTLS
jgi:hypothetical protein